MLPVFGAALWRPPQSNARPPLASPCPLTSAAPSGPRAAPPGPRPCADFKELDIQRLILDDRKSLSSCHDRAREPKPKAGKEQHDAKRTAFLTKLTMPAAFLCCSFFIFSSTCACTLKWSVHKLYIYNIIECWHHPTITQVLLSPEINDRTNINDQKSRIPNRPGCNQAASLSFSSSTMPISLASVS